jgi:nucleoside-diphosphate-sugar epimerase
MKVIITGGAGFIGLQLAQRLTALGSLNWTVGKTGENRRAAAVRRGGSGQAARRP